MDGRRSYDVIVIVIGAGAGGLTTVAYVAMTGHRVAVVDAREQPGGHMSAFTHTGYEFDTSLHRGSPGAAGALAASRQSRRTGLQPPAPRQDEVTGDG